MLISESEKYTCQNGGGGAHPLFKYDKNISNFHVEKRVAGSCVSIKIESM